MSNAVAESITRREKLTAKFMFMACGNLAAVIEATGLPEAPLRMAAAKEGWLKQFKAITNSIDPLIKQSVTKRIEKAREKHLHFVLDTLEDNQEKIEDMKDEVSTVKDAEVSPERRINLLDKHDQIARRTLGLDKEEKEDPIKEAFKYLVASQKQSLTTIEAPMEVLQLDEGEVEFDNIHNASAMGSLPEETNAYTGILSAPKVTPDTLNGSKNGHLKEIPDNLFGGHE